MTLQSQFAATLVDEFVRGGVRDVVIAPGSRSSPLAIAFVSDERVRCHVRLDERSGSFFALGTALQSGRPGVIVTTSGTAASEVHAAVIEADLARIPLIVLTADRPPELQAVGAPQTVNQIALFGAAPRYFCHLPVPDEVSRPFWRSMASRLLLEATAGAKGPGPVHCNLPFREPLVGPYGALDPGRPSGAPWHARLAERGVSDESLEAFVRLAGTERGLFLCGGGAFRPGEERDLLTLAKRLSWPVLADGRAFPRAPHSALVVHGDAILRSERARAQLQPELVVHVGAPSASRVVPSYFAELSPGAVEHVLIDPYGSFEDPERLSSLVIAAPAAALFHALLAVIEARAEDGSWSESWRRADDAVEQVISDLVDENEAITEPWVARSLVAHLPPGSTLFCSSSMPVRDVEWFAPARPDAPVVLANRGASGIDGIVSTVLGVAAANSSDAPVVGLLGDLAFFHDLSGFVFGRSEVVPDATFVVVDNAGGGIFSFLPYPGLFERDRFERAFGTPQVPEIGAITEALGARVVECSSKGELETAFAELSAEKGIKVLVVRTDRDENVSFHEALNKGAVAALEATLS